MELDRIYNMDCLEGMRDIPDGSIDCIICDLPYGTTRNKWDSVIPLPDLWVQYKRIIKQNGAIVLFGQQPFSSLLVASNLEMFRYEWIWKKSRATGHLNVKKMPLKIHENILVFYESLPIYNPQFTSGKPYKVKRTTYSSNYGQQKTSEANNEGVRYPTDIMDFNSEMKGIHPTQKPVELIRYLIRTYSNEGETILDNCMGSGTTAIAAIREKRHYIGFELNEEYYQKACSRISKELAQPTLNFQL